MKLNDVEILAIALLKENNLNDWTFYFDTAVKRFGCCRQYRKNISLSRKLVEMNNIDVIKNTILHEIAHALTPGHNHNIIWERKAIELGCDGQRYYSSQKVKMPKLKYTGTCINCDVTYQKSRIPKRRLSCGKCRNHFDINCLIKYKINNK